MICRPLFVLVYLFCCTIVLSDLLRYTESDYLFGIFKLFFSNACCARIVANKTLYHRIPIIHQRYDQPFCFCFYTPSRPIYMTDKNCYYFSGSVTFESSTCLGSTKYYFSYIQDKDKLNLYKF
jgi:hypothetical protein